jgi:aminopeptidase N
MLRRKLGDEAFWDGVRLYLERHAHGVVETNDLMRALEESGGHSLERFFDQWVYRPGHPDLRVKIGYEDGLLTVEVKQKQRGNDVATFAFPLEVLVKTRAGTLERHRKLMTETSDTLVVPLAERPRFVVFDPEFCVTASVKLDAPADFLRHALEDGPNARARWTAARALAERDDARSVEALAKSLGQKDEAWMVRAEAARGLGRLRGDEAFAALVARAHDRHPKVRRAVAEALGNFRTAAAARALKGVATEDKSYLVAAEASRALGRTRQPGVLKDLVRLVDRPSWADAQRAGALDGMSQLRDEAALPEVLARSRYGIPTRGRRAAVAALANLSDSRETRRHLEDLLDDRDPHFRITVTDALVQLGDPKARGALRRALEHELDGRVARRLREALRDIGEAGAHDRKRLGDDLESLRGELAELKQRLAKVEAKRSEKHAKKARSAPKRR